MIIKNDNLYRAAKKFAGVWYRGERSLIQFKARCRAEGFEYIGHNNFVVNDADKMLLFVLKWS